MQSTKLENLSHRGADMISEELINSELVYATMEHSIGAQQQLLNQVGLSHPKIAQDINTINALMQEKLNHYRGIKKHVFFVKQKITVKGRSEEGEAWKIGTEHEKRREITFVSRDGKSDVADYEIKTIYEKLAIINRKIHTAQTDLERDYPGVWGEIEKIFNDMDKENRAN